MESLCRWTERDIVSSGCSRRFLDSKLCSLHFRRSRRLSKNSAIVRDINTLSVPELVSSDMSS